MRRHENRPQTIEVDVLKTEVRLQFFNFEVCSVADIFIGFHTPLVLLFLHFVAEGERKAEIDESNAGFDVDTFLSITLQINRK